jgi:hypothetical protein
MAKHEGLVCHSVSKPLDAMLPTEDLGKASSGFRVQGQGSGPGFRARVQGQGSGPGFRVSRLWRQRLSGRAVRLVPR